jgi:hypothetical protein
MLINFGWPRLATDPNFNTLATWASSWPVIGGAPVFELYIAILLVTGGLYWILVQRHKSEQVVSGHEAALATSPADAGQ